MGRILKYDYFKKLLILLATLTYLSFVLPSLFFPFKKINIVVE